MIKRPAELVQLRTIFEQILSMASSRPKNREPRALTGVDESEQNELANDAMVMGEVYCGFCDQPMIKLTQINLKKQVYVCETVDCEKRFCARVD